MSTSRNNGIERQDQIINGFKRDAKSKNNNSASAQCMRRSVELKAIEKQKQIERENAPKFVFGSPAHKAYVDSKKK